MVPRPEPSGVRLYRALLQTYPAEFRDRFGDEMVQVLTASLRDAPASQRPGLLARAIADLARTVPAEHAAALRAPAPAPVGPPVGQQRLSGPLPSRRDFLRHAM